MTCRECPRFSSHVEPYAPWGEVVGEHEHNDCPEADHGSIWVDTVYCRWWRENIGTPGEQMRLGV